jgi:hypothetical protein
MDEAEDNSCSKCLEYDKCMQNTDELIKLLEAEKNKKSVKKTKTRKAK